MNDEAESRLRRVEDELAIHALAARFSDCVNERDFDGFVDLWSARGVWEIGPPLPCQAQGVDAIVAMLRRLLQPQTGFMQMTHSGVITLDGERATARFVEREHGRGETMFYENLAVYNDALLREADGKWRFLKRSYVYRYLDDSAFTGRVFPLAEPGQGASAEAARAAGVRT